MACSSFSSRGPREDGGFKPNIVAPGAAVSTVPGWQDGQPVAGTYALPPGYGMFNGTSMAAPQAAWRCPFDQRSQTDWRAVEAGSASPAIMSSARYLPAYGAYEQGMGLFQIDAAWNLLKTNN
jgi:hypothetical protein